MSGYEKDCRITLYLDTPKMLLKPGTDNIYGAKFGSKSETTWFTGHAFIGITDEEGHEQKWGFGPKDNVADSLLTYISGCPSYFRPETKSHYNEAIVYPITKDQYLAAENKIMDYLQRPDLEYKLFSRNCSTVASSIMKAAGVKSPSRIVGLTPHGLTIKKRLMYLERKAEVALVKAKSAIVKLFGGKPAPRTQVLKALKARPLPVSTKVGTIASKKGAKLTSRRILNAIMPQKARNA